uniref:Uncharacterized protein n=1 Tax=Ananas comosus var. bracteatus TaxID=296719 RepID=A0A6V7PLJ0_ANACO|nr:unnamed protein product [Ananas comosus var. bracteatus]
MHDARQWKSKGIEADGRLRQLRQRQRGGRARFLDFVNSGCGTTGRWRWVPKGSYTKGIRAQQSKELVDGEKKLALPEPDRRSTGVAKNSLNPDNERRFQRLMVFLHSLQDGVGEGFNAQLYSTRSIDDKHQTGKDLDRFRAEKVGRSIWWLFACAVPNFAYVVPSSLSGRDQLGVSAPNYERTKLSDLLARTASESAPFEFRYKLADIEWTALVAPSLPAVFTAPNTMAGEPRAVPCTLGAVPTPLTTRRTFLTATWCTLSEMGTAAARRAGLYHDEIFGISKIFNCKGYLFTASFLDGVYQCPQEGFGDILTGFGTKEGGTFFNEHLRLKLGLEMFLASLRLGLRTYFGSFVVAVKLVICKKKAPPQPR